MSEHAWYCLDCGEVGANRIDYSDGSIDMECNACGSLHTEWGQVTFQVAARSVRLVKGGE